MGLLGKIWVKLGLDNSELDKGFKDSEKSASGFQNSLKKIGGMMAAAFSVTAVINFAKKSISAYNESALALSKLESVLKATGNASGFTSKQLQDFAYQLQTVTRFEDDTTIAAMSVLSAFKGIRGDIFKQTIKSAMDMSTVIGGDLQGNVYQLAKALERPAEGIQLLNRSTRAFSLAQIEDIKKLVAEGKTQEAQLIMLAALQGKYGGAAEDAATTSIGAWDRVGNAIGNLMEKLGEASNKTKSFANVLASTLEYLGADSGEVGFFTKLGVLFGSPLAISNMQKTTAEMSKQRKIAEEYANTQMASIKTVEQAEAKRLSIEGLKSAGWDLLREKLIKYIADRKQVGAVDAEEAEGEIAVIENGLIPTYERLIAEVEKKIRQTTDQSTLQALVEEKKGLETLVERWKTTTQAAADYLSMIEAIRAENDQMPIRPVDSSKVDAKGQATIQPLTQPGIQAAPKTNDPTGLKAYNDEFDAEVLRSADIAANFGRTVASSISDSMRVIMDAIASGEKIDASDMTKAILMPFADMATQIGEVMVATGAAALAAKAIGTAGGPWGAIAAGAALIALGTAASAAIGSIGSGFGGKQESDPYSYNGGATPTIAAVNSGPVEIFGVLKGQDIYLSSQKYQQNKAR